MSWLCCWRKASNRKHVMVPGHMNVDNHQAHVTDTTAAGTTLTARCAHPKHGCLQLSSSCVVA
jgi:hypothetical protein